MSSLPVPQHCPTPVELDDLELLLIGAVPSRGFNQPGSALTLTLPEGIGAAARAVGEVELVDPEGLPLARVAWPAGTVQALVHAQYGPFRDLMLSPADYRRQYAGRTVVPVVDALTEAELGRLAGLGPVALLALVGTGTPALSLAALVRATRAAAEVLPDAVVATVPMASHVDPDADRVLREQVVAAFAGPDPVVELVEAPRNLDAYPPDIAAIVTRDQPAPDRQGLVLFFTGLSGSGKSTLARALVDRILEQGERTVSSLDGDVVRRNLSAGLTFSREDRETNIRRIGWVAAEIARHGGVAVVSPIAPYDETRQQVRAMVEDAGGAFFIVHVATPLEECERRDRKGLYARARAGEIPDFTGISSPYEQPQDADVRVDTTGRTIDDALSDVLIALRDAGYLDLAPAVVGRGGAHAKTASTPSNPTLDATVDSATTHHHPLHVLFVCTANICRSPTLELLARQAIPDPEHAVFTSAGTHGVDGHPIDDGIAEALPESIDATGFRSHRLTNVMLDEADLVLTAQVAHRSFILDDRPELFRKVFTLGQLAEAARHVPPGLHRAEILTKIGENRWVADPALDVADPYRQGVEAHLRCVTQLERLLDNVIPMLATTGAADD